MCQIDAGKLYIELIFQFISHDFDIAFEKVINSQVLSYMRNFFRIKVLLKSWVFFGGEEVGEVALTGAFFTLLIINTVLFLEN